MVPHGLQVLFSTLFSPETSTPGLSFLLLTKQAPTFSQTGFPLKLPFPMSQPPTFSSPGVVSFSRNGLTCLLPPMPPPPSGTTPISVLRRLTDRSLFFSELLPTASGRCNCTHTGSPTLCGYFSSYVYINICFPLVHLETTYGGAHVLFICGSLVIPSMEEILNEI